jgi:DNA processing protein
VSTSTVTSTILSAGDATYPEGLAAIGSPLLYTRGRVPLGAGVAIVGTRRATAEARSFTAELARALVGEGLAIWSGGAIGIDAAAHEAALAAGGATVVVAGGGLDRPYPQEHGELFDRVVARGGALVARVPDDTPPTRPGFLARNQVLAAATAATVVVQAGFVSGARSAAAAARRIGRVLCVVPHSPWDELGKGCALELTRGAIVVLSSADVLVALGRPPPPPRPRAGRRPPRAEAGSTLPLALGDADAHDLTPDEEAILAVIDMDAACVDEVCERSGRSAHVVTAALLTLTLRAVVVEGPAGFIRRFPPSAGS